VRVFKYRGGPAEILRRDLRTLAKNQIFAAPIETLNDPFETRVNIHDETFKIGRVLSVLSFFKYDEETKESERTFLDAIQSFEAQTKTWGIYSLSQTYKDELLWAYYADAHRGFCIEYELDVLLDYQLKHEMVIDVDYIPDIPVFTLHDISSIINDKKSLIKKFIGTKSIRWKHESEMRIITARPGLYEFDFRAVKAIYFGHRSDEKFKQLAMRVLKGRGIRYYSVETADGSYHLERIEIADRYHYTKRYRERAAPVEAGVPYLDDKTPPFARLITTAIDIVRREPYCEKIIDAYLCGSQGTSDDPVFYITYERSDGVPQNFFISKREIESSPYYLHA
jgi:hypothetical protein